MRATVNLSINPRHYLLHQLDLDEALKVAPIVANAGLYNGFITAGLIWGLVSGKNGDVIKVFFLVCVIIAGIFGAVTLKWTTLLIQTAQECDRSFPSLDIKMEGFR
jgi:putative membrane protein